VNGIRHNKDSEAHSGVVSVSVLSSFLFSINNNISLFFDFESCTTQTRDIYDPRASYLVENTPPRNLETLPLPLQHGG
jgi:hypothetical protein